MTLLVHSRNMLVLGGLALALVTTHARDAEACGCFTPPDPTVPIVQAGERILFAMDNGEVTAHIQIQYAGEAKDFGWLLPLPSVPTMELGTDELFNSLINTTQPKYQLLQKYDGTCGFANVGRGGFNAAPTAGTGAGGATGSADASNSVLVIQASIGPYDYAVLHADSKDAMLQWLTDNHYFVPAGTDQTVGAYIHPGAYFLALKLQSGKSAGDLQPVVVRYPSDLPMIPIVLTSVAAQPNMGIQVWMLGAGRAIPRNYYHTVINDLAIDWASSGQNYNDVIIKAVGEAPGKHSFVTEYAGPSTIMQKVLNPDGRFGSQAELAASPTPAAFVTYLQTHRYPFNGQVLAILGAALPVPAALAAQGITPTAFYQNLAYYQSQNPSAFVGWPGAAYDPVMLAQDLQDRIVKPTLDAGALFDKYTSLTRLYTTLSPQDMTLDPVFSFNPGLPGVAKEHTATLTYFCGRGSNDRTTTPARLDTEQGWVRSFPTGTGLAVVPPPPSGLAARRLEILREEGAPEVVSDNVPPGQGCGCVVASNGGRGAGVLLVLAMATAAVLRRRRRECARRG